MDITRQDLFKLASAGVLATLGTQTKAEPRASAINRTLIRGADVLTMDPSLGEMLNTDVLIEGEKIVQIGRGISAASAEVVDARGMILMPGLIDGHRHNWEGIETGRLVKISNNYSSGYQQWKERLMVCITPADSYLMEYLGGVQAIDYGVTCMLNYAHIHHTQDMAVSAAKGALASGIAGAFAYQISHTPSYGQPATVPSKQSYNDRLAPPDAAHWRTAQYLREHVFGSDDALLQFGVATSNAQGVRPVAEFGEELKRIRGTLKPRLICTHLNKQVPTPPDSVYFNVTQLERAGLLGPDYHITHGNEISDAEMVMLKDAGSKLCASPAGEWAYPSPSMHGRAYSAGLDVGIGTDVPLALQQDFFEHIRTAYWSLYRSETGAKIANRYTSSTALEFATILGAKAMGIGDVTGSIARGKRADLLLLRTDRFGFAQLGTLAERVVNFGTAPDIDRTWINGKLRKKGGKMIGIDWISLKRQQIEFQQRIGAKMDTVKFG